MKKKSYFLIFLFVLICLVVNSSYATNPSQLQNHIKETNLENNQNMLISEISTNNLNNIDNQNNSITQAKNIDKNIKKENTSVTIVSATKDTNQISKVITKTQAATTTQTNKNSKSTTKTKTSINFINQNQFYKNKYIEAELVDNNKKRILDTPVYMTLTYNKNTKTYKLGTNSKGIIKVEITLTGTYSVKFEFKGNNKYLASNSSKITVIKDLSLDTIKTASQNLKKEIEKMAKYQKQ